ncbi:MAG: FAD-dependent oxidoreductase [Burkholderiaceae bacterium]|nr:FAD-dependent oxidoreductase [Burkholderiaceae bacterium]
MKLISKSLVAVAVSLAFGSVGAAEHVLNTDVVVIGTGSAGLSATVQAAEAGAKVITLEKNPFIGGGTAFAEGLFGVESEWNRLRSDTLTREKAFEGIMERHMHEPNAQQVRDFVWGCAENLEWLAKHDIKFEVVRMTPWEEATWHVIAPYTNSKGVTTNHGAALVNALKDHADKLGVKTMVQTPATELIANKKGEVVGVKAINTRTKDTYTINAKKVIIATGGFADSAEKVQAWSHRDPQKWVSCAPINKTGDGIQMAVDKGAAMGQVSYVGTYGTADKNNRVTIGDMLTASWQPSALWVNAKGERFDNEEVAFSFSQAGNSIYRQQGSFGWTIFDEKQIQFMENQGVDSGVGVIVPVGAKLKNLRNEIAENIAKGADHVVKASSIEELAKKTSLPVGNLKKAFETYNQACDQGFDGQFFKKSRYLRKLDPTKLYAVKLRALNFTSIGGLLVNRNFEVLDKAGNPIKNLYAAGVDLSGYVGATYTTWSSGYAFGFSAYSGRHAGLNAANAIKASK